MNENTRVYISGVPYVYLEGLTLNEQFNEIIKIVQAHDESIKTLDDFIKSLNLEIVVEEQLRKMVEDGTIAEIINQEIFNDIITRLESVEEQTKLLTDSVVEFTTKITTNSNAIIEINNTLTDINERVNQSNQNSVNALNNSISANEKSIEAKSLVTQLEVELINLPDTLYPIGIEVVFHHNNDMSSWLGFNWQRCSAGLTNVGIDESQDEFNTIDKIGGEKSHILTVDELAKHKHGIGNDNSTVMNAAINYGDITGGGGIGVVNLRANAPVISGVYGSNIGNNQPHNNLQPYIVVAKWKRIA